MHSQKERKGTYHINMPLLLQNLDLSLGQARETEHTNLAGDMFPSTGCPLGLQSLPQTLSHLLDPATHGPQVILPFLEQLWIIQHAAGDSRAVGRGIGDLGALEDGQLRSDIGVRGSGIGAGPRYEVEGTRALAVQTEVLGEGLRNAQLESLLDEVADGPRVPHEVARGEALVGGVEEREVRFLAHHGGDLFPLVLGGVDAGRVMRAGVEQDDAAGRGGAEGVDHAVEVEALGFGGEVRVVGERETDIGEDLVVVGPCWAGEVDFWLRGVEFRQEEAAQMDGAGAGDGLEGADLFGTFSFGRGFKLIRWRGHTRFSRMAALSSPKTSFWAAEVKSARPLIPRYSWLRLGSLRTCSSAYRL